MRPIDAYDPQSIPRWTHDDNMLTQGRGWIILPFDAYGGAHDIVSTNPSRLTPAQIYDEQIVPFVETDPLCAKAFAFLLGERMKYPNHVFAHLKNDSNRKARGPSFVHGRAVEALKDARKRVLDPSPPMQDGGQTA